MVQLPREYKTVAPTWVVYGLGCVFGGGGFVMLCVGIIALIFHADRQFILSPLGMGALFLCIGIGAPVYMRRSYTRVIINCTPDGFSVTSENKRSGKRYETYWWQEVTSTDYEESSDVDFESSGHFAFSVDTVRGRAFTGGRYMHPLDELIIVFNERTPHLPYIWARGNGRPAYQKFPRPLQMVATPMQRPVPSSTPPPPPPSSYPAEERRSLDMVQLPREFKNTTPPWLPLIVAAVFGVVGLYFLIPGISDIFLGAKPSFKLMPLGFGATFFLVAISSLIQGYWNYIRHTINCTPAGFTVLKESKRRGARREEYRWAEVTGTKYEFTLTRGRKGRKRIAGFFSAQTIRGPAFKIDKSQSDFDELITVFNEQTSHLPYIWTRDSAFTDRVVWASSAKPEYNKIPRLPQTIPPPPPTSRPPPLPPSN